MFRTAATSSELRQRHDGEPGVEAVVVVAGASLPNEGREPLAFLHTYPSVAAEQVSSPSTSAATFASLNAHPETARREVLLKAKCKALVRSRWGDVVDDAVGATFPGGAALAGDARAWVLAEDDPERTLGAALVLATRHAGADGECHLMTTGAAGTLARRAALFDRKISVWSIQGTALAPSPASPDPLPASLPLAPGAEAMRVLLERAGAEAVVEGGILRAEVRGLEVARVEIDDDGPRLAVGVGKHDREAQREVHGTVQGFDELFEVVRIVAEHRVADGEGHAAYHLSPERWLRSIVVRRPDLVGAAELRPVPSPVFRHDLRQPAAAPAAGTDAATHPVLAICSVGADIDVVPSAVDAWLADGRRPRLVFCMPEGDDHAMTRELIAALSMPAELRTVPRTWRSL